MSYLFLTAFDFKTVFSNVVSNWYYYLAALIVVAVIIVLTVKKQPKRANLNSTQKLVYVAVLSALATVANIFDIRISEELQISLIATVGFIAGYLFGGGIGFAVCFIGDLLGAIINPHGAYNPVIAIGTGLWGFIPGIIFSFFRGNKYLKLAISFVLCVIIISAGLNTLGIWLMYGLGKRTFVYYLAFLPWKLLGVAVNLVISVLLLEILNRVLPKDKFNL